MKERCYVCGKTNKMKIDKDGMKLCPSGCKWGITLLDDNQIEALNAFLNITDVEDGDVQSIGKILTKNVNTKTT